MGVPYQMSANAIKSNQAEGAHAHSQGAPWLTPMFTSAALSCGNGFNVKQQCRNAEFDKQDMGAPRIMGAL